MARLNVIFVDTSVFVSGLFGIGEGAAASRRVVERAAERAIRSVTAWHCCLEFYSVVTRLPPGFRVPPADALRLLEENILAHFGVHQLQDKSLKRFLSEAARGRISGGRIYDAHIAEIAAETGARTVVTENLRHFASLSTRGIAVVTAAELAD